MTIRKQTFEEHGYMPWDFGNLTIAIIYGGTETKVVAYEVLSVICLDQNYGYLGKSSMLYKPCRRDFLDRLFVEHGLVKIGDHLRNISI